MSPVRASDRHPSCGAGAEDTELKSTDGSLVTFAVQELGLPITGRFRALQQNAVRGLMVRAVSDGWAEAKKARARERAKERRQEKRRAK